MTRSITHPEQRELQDVVTCIREHVTLEQAGTRLASQCRAASEARRRKWRGCSATRPRQWQKPCASPTASAFTLDQLGQRYPHEPVPRGKTADGHLRDLTEAGLHMALSRKACRPRSRHWRKRNCAFIAERQIAHYFLTVHDIVKFARRPGHSLPGPRLGRQFRGLLCPGRHLGRSHRDRCAVRALPQRRTARAARHRCGFRA